MDYNKIKNIISRKGYSIKAFFEEKIGITEDGFYKAIRNHTMKVRDLEKISEELDVPMSYWFEEEDGRLMENTANERDSSPAYRNLREDMIRTQARMIQFLEKDNKRLEEELRKCLREMHGRGVG